MTDGKEILAPVNMSGVHYSATLCDDQPLDHGSASQRLPHSSLDWLARASLFLMSGGLLLAITLLLIAAPHSVLLVRQDVTLLTSSSVGEPLQDWEGQAGPDITGLHESGSVLRKFLKGSGRVHHPINQFNDQLDSVLFQATGLYYQFTSEESQVVWEGEVEGREGSFTHKTDGVPLASASKLFTSLAAMRTMQLKPHLFFPNQEVHTFKGWENWRFNVAGSSEFASLTIHQLLTHTSGLPFTLHVSKADIQKMQLFYKPGTKFGYTLGHRVIGWLLRDFWKNQPEGRRAGIKTVQDTYKWLVFDPLQLSPTTKFSTSMAMIFGAEGDAGDAAIQSTGEDMAKLAVLALRRGKLPDGKIYISRKNWNKWAVPNLLPGRKLSTDLVDWQNTSATWANWNHGGQKEAIMKQSGKYGWNYFGATYYNSKEIGWCGFFSSCLRVSYSQGLAFVMMQRDTSDLKNSKPYLIKHFDEMARSLQCKYKRYPTGNCPNTSLGGPCKSGYACNIGDCCLLGDSCNGCPFGSEPNAKSCGLKGGSMCSSRFCEKVTKPGLLSLQTGTKHDDVAWSVACPYSVNRHKSVFEDKRLDDKFHTCYMPRCGLMPLSPAGVTFDAIG